MSNINLLDDEFYIRYEQALDGLSEMALAQVAMLDPKKLREWVYSPAKIRPHLLKKWKDEDEASKLRIEKVIDTVSSFSHDMQEKLDKQHRASVKARAELEKKQKERRKKSEEHFENSKFTKFCRWAYKVMRIDWD